nr:SymE family type I addiction module toxin [Rosenbergiella australiborealis]
MRVSAAPSVYRVSAPVLSYARLHPHSASYSQQYVRDRIKHQSLPSIILKGHWIQALGFETDRKVEVSYQQGELIIRLAEE